MRAWPPWRVSARFGKSCVPDPFSTLSPHLEALRKTMFDLIGSSHPILSEVTQYYLQQPSKYIRPLLIFLFSQATNGMGKDWQLKLWESTHPGGGGCEDELDIPLSPPDILMDYNPQFPQYTERFNGNFFMTYGASRLQRKPYPRNEKPPSLQTTPKLHPSTGILPTQFRLAIIIEMIHTASLLHDDVLDASVLRRGVSSAPAKFSAKLCVLGGNFMVTRASGALFQLRNPEVTRMLSRSLQNLIEGEMIQMKDVIQAAADDVSIKLDSTKRSQKHQDMWNTYLQKSYLKTGSLMARGLRGASMLGGCVQGEIWREVAYAYGRNFGIAFQLVDDALDYESAAAALGKPNNADLKLGLTTAPALYAWEEFPEMGELIRREFKSPGDVEQARELVSRSSAISRTRQLAQEYADGAKKVLQELPDSEARDMLEVLAEDVVARKQ